MSVNWDVKHFACLDLSCMCGVYYCKNRLVVFHRKYEESLLCNDTRDKKLRGEGLNGTVNSELWNWLRSKLIFSAISTSFILRCFLQTFCHIISPGAGCLLVRFSLEKLYVHNPVDGPESLTFLPLALVWIFSDVLLNEIRKPNK